MPIILTATKGGLDRAFGYELGADMCLSKPVLLEELCARVRSLLRQRMDWIPEVAGDCLDCGGVTLYLEHRLAKVDGNLIALPKELFLLLRFFMQSPGEVITRQKLRDCLWGTSDPRNDPSLKEAIRRLRERIEADPSNPKRLRTTYGVGYRLIAE